MKYEWKKAEKDVYLPGDEPQSVVIPNYKYFTVSGAGDPNGEEFGQKVAALYAMSYVVKMMPRNGFTPAGYFEYTVYPLEGVWSGDALEKSSYSYTIMIRQPDFVNAAVFEKALEIAKKKKPNPELTSIRFEELADGKCVQMMHIGSYDSELESFAVMDAYLTANHLERGNHTHREIYLSGPTRVTPAQQKTVLRYFVR